VQLLLASWAAQELYRWAAQDLALLSLDGAGPWAPCPPPRPSQTQPSPRPAKWLLVSVSKRLPVSKQRPVSKRRRTRNGPATRFETDNYPFRNGRLPVSKRLPGSCFKTGGPLACFETMAHPSLERLPVSLRNGSRDPFPRRPVSKRPFRNGDPFRNGGPFRFPFRNGWPVLKRRRVYVEACFEAAVSKRLPVSKWLSVPFRNGWPVLKQRCFETAARFETARKRLHGPPFRNGSGGRSPAVISKRHLWMKPCCFETARHPCCSETAPSKRHQRSRFETARHCSPPTRKPLHSCFEIPDETTLKPGLDHVDAPSHLCQRLAP